MTDAAPLWRRNVAGAVFLGAALSFVVATQLWPDWALYRATEVPQQTVARGESATVDGQRWSVESVRSTDAGRGIPDGATQTVVTLGRAGPDTDQNCTATLTDGTRRWDPDPYAAAATGTTRCGPPGPLELTFTTPAGVAATAVDVVGSDGRIMLRLML